MKWFARLYLEVTGIFRPKKLYIVFNDEEHVGRFFCEAFYDRELAEDYIRVVLQFDLNQHAELDEMMKEEVAAGRYPADLYEPADLTQSMLKLSIVEYDISLGNWIAQRKKMLEPSVK